MWFLLFSGLLGLSIGLVLILIPIIFRFIERYTDQTVLFDVEEGSFFLRVLIGLVQILAGIWLIYVYIIYRQLWYLLYIGFIALFFGYLFMFFPNLLKKLNEMGNLPLSSGKEVGTLERVMYGLIISLLGVYILFIYFTNSGKI